MARNGREATNPDYSPLSCFTQPSCSCARHHSNSANAPSPSLTAPPHGRELLSFQVCSQSWNGKQEFCLSIVSLTETSPVLLAQHLAKPTDQI